MSKSELINNASEDENNGTEESETSDLQSYMYEPCVSKVSVKENCPGKNHQLQKKALVQINAKN